MIFVDTGAFLARYVERDQYHTAANDFWHELDQSNEPIVTSSLVLCELFTLLARRARAEFAVNRARSIYSSARLDILRPTLDDETDALNYLAKFADQQLSFVDCVSFALMKRNRIQRTFTFDLHFRLAGFAIWPEKR